MKKKILQCSFMLLAVIWTGFFLKSAYAFNISPTRVEISLPAGGSQRGTYVITNPTDELISINVFLQDRSVGAIDTNRDRLALEWFTIHPHKLDIAPGEKKEVKYEISIPERAEGEYSARISFAKAPLPGKSMLGVQSVMTFSVYVAVKGTEVIKGDVVGFEVYKTDPLEVRVTIQNSGNIHIRPKGEVVLATGRWFDRWFDIFRKDRKEIILPLNKYEFPIYPFSERTLKIKSKEKLLAGRYKVRVNMEFGPEIVQKEFSFTVTSKGEVTVVGM